MALPWAMSKLSSTIVQLKVAPLRDVEEAIARQVLYGGDLVTNLLQQAAGLDESALTRLLAEHLGVDPAPAGELPKAEPDTLRSIPADIAVGHGLYPLRRTDDTLVVAVCERLKEEVLRELSFALGFRVAERAAPLVRIRQAISRDYGIALDRRTRRVLAKIEGKPDPSPSMNPGALHEAPEISMLPRPPSIPPVGQPARSAAPANAPVGQPARSAAPANAPVGQPARSAAPANAPVGQPARSAAPANAPVGASQPSMKPVRVAAEADLTPTPSIHEVVTAPAPPVQPIQEEGRAATAGPRSSQISAPSPSQESVPSDRRAAAAQESVPSARRAAPGHEPVARTHQPEHRQPSAPALAALREELKRSAADRPRQRHRGPYTAAKAEEDLVNAENRDGALGALFDFAAQYFEYAALFAVHGDIAEGRDAHGPGADRNAVLGIGVPLDLPSSLSRVRDDLVYTLNPLSDTGLDAQLAKDLERHFGRKVLLLPVAVRGRCVLIFYGDYGDHDVELSEVGDVIAFAPLVAAALENIIKKKKLSARASARPPSSLSAMNPLRERRSSIPSLDERAEALANALQKQPGERRSSRPPRMAAPPPKPAPSQVPSGVLASKAPPKERPAQNPGELAAKASRRPSPPPKPTGPQGSKAPSANRPASSSAPRSLTPRQGTPAQASLRSPPPKPAERVPLRSEPPVFELTRRTPGSEPEAGEGDGGWETSTLPSGDEDTEHLLPDSRSVVVAAKPLTKRHSSEELRLPTVILNVEEDFTALIAQLLAGDEGAIDRLLELGTPAISGLVARFPGPIEGGNRPGAASEHGPILKALARFGEQALPFVLVRTNDADAHVRTWATRLLGEIPAADSARAIVRRLSDTDPTVRRAALDSGRRYEKQSTARAALRDAVCAVATDSSQSDDARLAALEAVADWRDGRCVPKLMKLASEASAIGKSVRWALEVLTRQNFGALVSKWEAWWTQHGGEHRIEWLIGALMHEDPHVRRAAGDELKSLTKEYFGYYDDLPAEERAHAQQRYRDWWERAGKARFS